MKKLLTIIFTLTLLGCVALWGAVHFLEEWSNRTTSVPIEVIVELKQGMPIAILAVDLESRKLIDVAFYFRAWMKFSGGYHQFQAGNYSFSGDISPAVIKAKMMRGETFTPLALSVTIPEGFTIKQLNDRLVAKSVSSHQELSELIRDIKFQKELGLDSKTLEGFTYPATYTFETQPTAKEFYTKVVKTFFARLPEDYEAKAKA